MREEAFDIIVIGGSSGSITVIIALLKSLPEKFSTPILLIIHRMRNTTSRLNELLARETGVKSIVEPEDKEPIKAGLIYLAPQNYHLLVEQDHTFSLDYSEPVNFGRPSIDVSFESVANLFGKKTLAILLSGSNKDGAAGLAKVIEKGGLAIAQLPETAQYPAMPRAAINLNSSILVQSPEQILNCILHYPYN